MNPDDTQQNQANPNDPLPAFLNDQSAEFDPMRMSGIDQGVSDQGASQQISVPGSPEAGSITVTENQPGSTEFSPELHRSSESSAESIEAKDAVKSQQTIEEPIKRPVSTVKKEEKKPAAKIFGYMIPENLIRDIDTIQKGVSSGPVDQPLTWLNILLDKLIKVNATKK